MSSVCDVTAIDSQIRAVGDENVTFENYLLKAASKAYHKVFEHNANVSRVTADGLQYYQSANEKQLSGLSSASHEVHEGLNSFGSGSPAAHITVS